MLALGIDIGGTRVKLALLRDGEALAHQMGERYRDPRPAELLAAAAACARALADQAPCDIGAVGLCAPGVLCEDRTRIVYSANLPALADIELAEIASAALRGLRASAACGLPPVVRTDQIAAATDYAWMRNVRGRLLSINIGTGVGAAVLDCDDEHPLGRPLRVNGDSPGHIGQMDVSLDEEAPVGPDGGAGSLEAYIGAGALRGRDPAGLSIQAAPVRALVRAMRICHAIYRPDEIALLGGVGIRLRHLDEELRQRAGDRLSRIARPGWGLGFGEDDFHAARGAARLACAEQKRGD